MAEHTTKVHKAKSSHKSHNSDPSRSLCLQLPPVFVEFLGSSSFEFLTPSPLPRFPRARAPTGVATGQPSRLLLGHALPLLGHFPQGPSEGLEVDLPSSPAGRTPSIRVSKVAKLLQVTFLITNQPINKPMNQRQCHRTHLMPMRTKNHHLPQRLSHPHQ